MTTNTPAGWYPDPYGTPQLRWWDGGQWTDATHPVEQGRQESAPPPQPAPGPAPVGPPPGGAAPQDHAAFAPPSGPGPQPGPPTGPPPGPSFGTQPGPPFGTQPGSQAGHGAPTQQYDQSRWAQQPQWGPGPQGGTAQMPVPDFGQPPGGPQRRSNVWPWVLGGGGALIVVIAIIVAVVFVVNAAPDELASGQAPVPSASPPGLPDQLPEPSLPPIPTEPGPETSPVPLPQPENGRITDEAAGLSYAVPKGAWRVPKPAPGQAGVQPWTSKVEAISQERYNGENDWIGNIYTGPLLETIPYNGPESLEVTANTLFQYYNQTSYGPPHGQRIIKNEARKIGGRDAWVVEFELDFTPVAKDNNWKWRKERGAIVLVDRPDEQHPALLYMSVPDNLDTGNVQRVLDSLKLS
ncbi:hypothetical protein Misp01_74700 [Microtetraspora sp. NBRC 13810]|uniref:DUF2510 domain-containing protein n=1 Tax=Microtetraspora sp. NBRC 13810 TaxID=3030990 RepID=UPI0024A04576|nr:DUF2510 domain-containing protein [Microtetraspora sp. NBRC 13810]GLW12342.1 hypothetical protein Misp01_74700 [Microtetraspora sp. NBRC 13810]